MAQPKFEVIEEEPDQPETGSFAVSGVMLALRALSQRALVALEAGFTLLTVGLVWVLWWLTPAPTPNQIISLSIFAVFVLLANALVLFRRKK